MIALKQHIQKQQDTACTLCGVIEAIAILDNQNPRQGAIVSLLVVAGELAERLNNNLDCALLPEGDQP